MNVTRAVLPVMRKQRAGHIISISSSAGLAAGFDVVSAYAAWQCGLEGWMESLHAEVALFGITTTVVNPAFFRTEHASGTHPLSHLRMSASGFTPGGRARNRSGCRKTVASRLVHASFTGGRGYDGSPRIFDDFVEWHHSDQGSTYASEDYQAVLETPGITCSMSRRGNCYDNAVMEAFFSTVKNEVRERYESHGDAKGSCSTTSKCSITSGVASRQHGG